MKTLLLFAALSLLALPGFTQNVYGPFDDAQPQSILAEPQIKKAVLPAYRIAEGVSDRLYGLISLRIFLRVLPDTIYEDLRRAPEKDSYDLFARHFQSKQERFVRRMRDSHPRYRPHGGDGVSASRLEAWQARAGNEQVSVLVDVFRDTLLERYQILLFRDSTEYYAKDSRHWTPSFIALGAGVGGGFLFYNGMHATMNVRKVKIGLDLASGKKIYRAARNGGDLKHAAGLELGYKGIPVTLSTDCGLAKGKLRSETVALNLHKRF